MLIPCFCGRRELALEHTKYAINGTPCCDMLCYDAAMEAQGVRPGVVVMVSVRRPVQTELPFPFGLTPPPLVLEGVS